MIKALIFDVDGTLSETEEAHRKAFNDTFVAEQLEWFWGRDEYRRLLKVAGGKERLRYYRDERGETHPSDTQIQQIHARKTERYRALLARDEVALRPGVKALITQARVSGLLLAIATTTSRSNVEALCLANWSKPAAEVFDVIASGDEVNYKKPHPEIYQLALERLGVMPEDAVAVEDSSIGLAAARAAGLACVVTPSVYTEGDDFTTARWLVPSLDEWMAEFRNLVA